MMRKRWAPIILFLLVAFPVFLRATEEFEAAEAEQPVLARDAGDSVLASQNDRPKLAVVLVFDQLRGDYLVKWRHLFGEDGFKRLQKEGAYFDNCHYPYASTLTACGHASLLTGATPRQHGIIANGWYDRKLGKSVSSVTNPGGPGPQRRLLPTLGDVMLTKTGGKSKIGSLSIKDRAAILLAALRAQFCLWFSSSGNVTTSSHYNGGKLPAWASAFNNSKQVQQWLKPWTRFDPKLDYAKFSGPDDSDFEGNGYKQGRTFPHPTPSISALMCSPAGNDVLLALATRAIDAEQLGQDDVPDLLCISFSSNDLVGHCYGPDSQEVLDITLQSDRIVAKLLKLLDDKVGRGKYAVAISADHGVSPIPELLQAQGKKAGRVPGKVTDTDAEAFLQRTFAAGKPRVPWFEKVALPWVYLDVAKIRSLGLDQAKVESALAGCYAKQPGIQSAFTRTQLSTSKPFADPLAERVRQSFHPQAAGDVYVVFEPYFQPGNPLKRRPSTSYTTTHGSPHPYDTHVPLIVMGPGIRPGTYSQEVPPQLMANLLAHSLGIEAPAGAQYAPPKKVLK